MKKSMLEARAKIVKEAQKVRQASNMAILTEVFRTGKNMVLLRPFTERHIQRCVSICRHQRLVGENTLIAAGFNPHA